MKSEGIHPENCFICTDTYSHEKRPLILVCGHTFCEVCLQNLYDTSSEIQCSFCKVITKLEKFDDMIINYAILELVEYYKNNKVQQSIENQKIETTNYIHTQTNCYLNHKNEKLIENLLQCKDCEEITCKECIDIHKNHKMTNLIDYIDNEANVLSEFLKNYRELLNKMTILNKKLDKNELEKLIKIEKENAITCFKELRNIIDKNQDMVLHTLDKLLKDCHKNIDSYKKEIKTINHESQRFTSIIEEMCNFKNINNKQQAKVLNIYNINSTFSEIKQFNKEIETKISHINSYEFIIKKFTNLMKSCTMYKNKMQIFHNLIIKKLNKKLEVGFTLHFYTRRHHI